MPAAIEVLGNAVAAGERVLNAYIAGCPVTVPPAFRDERLAICQACPSRDDGRCDRCGCVIAWKAALATERCPLGRWPA